jgi:histidine phosphotransferase ChpT
MLSDIEFLELLSAKFCHDLAGPIGAISNGLDFLHSKDSLMREKSINLIQDSSDKSVATIKLFRILYGTVKSVGEANLSDIKTLLEEYFKTSKIKLDWPDDHLFVQGYSINNRVAKLIVAIVIGGTSLLVNTGVISVRLNKVDQGCQVNISITDKNIKESAQYVQALSANIEAEMVNNKNINFYLIKRYADLLDVKPVIEEKDQQINFVVNLTEHQI